MIEYFIILVVAFSCITLRRSLIPPLSFEDNSNDYFDKLVDEELSITDIEKTKVASKKREEWANRTVGLLHAMLLVTIGLFSMFTDFERIIFSLAVGYFVYDSVSQVQLAALKSFATIAHHVISTFILAGYFFIPSNVACQIFCIGEIAVVFIAILWRVRNANNNQLIRLLKLLVKFSYSMRVFVFVLGFIWYGAGNITLLQVSTYPKLVGVIFILVLNILWLLDILTDGSPTELLTPMLGLLYRVFTTVILRAARVVGLRNIDFCPKKKQKQ